MWKRSGWFRFVREEERDLMVEANGCKDMNITICKGWLRG